MTLKPRLVPVSVGTLRRGVTYVSLSGRLCRLAPPGGDDASDGNTYVFEYVDSRRRGAFERERFDMARSNISLLCEVRA